MIPSDPAEREGQRVDEWSIVRFDGRREVITMRLESSRSFGRAALVMPVPSRASFALGDDAAFAAMAERTKPRVERRERHRSFGGGASDEGAGGGPATGAGVDVVDSQDLGPLRVVTLRGDDAGIVRTWLSDQGFATPEGLEPIAQDYLDRGWLLVAARLRGRGGQEVRKLQPLVVRFATGRVVYPLRMSELAPAGAQARVDVVAPGPVTVDNRPSVDVAADRATEPGRLFGGPLPGGRYLSTFRFVVSEDDPKEDPEFVPSERDDFRQVRYVYEDVDVTGWVILGVLGALAAVALAVALFVVLLVRRRRRAARRT